MAIEFTNKPIKWTNEGTAPSEDLKTNGFQAGYKPPAAVFNNQWHTTGECIEELQTKLSGVDDKADTKVDKVSGKSLIDENVAEKVSYDSESGNVIVVGDGVMSTGLKISDSSNSSNGLILDPYGIARKQFDTFGAPPFFIGATGANFDNPEADVVIKGKDGQPKHKLTKKANTSDVLTKTNTEEFTPTADYNPATKKYVDDKATALPIRAGDADDTAIIGDMRSPSGSGSTPNQGNIVQCSSSLPSSTFKGSTAIGTRNAVTGSNGGIAIGRYNLAKSSNGYAFAFGAGNKMDGCSMGIGWSNTHTGNNPCNNILIGSNNTTSSSTTEYATVLGLQNTGWDYGTVIGRSAKVGARASYIGTTGDAFIIGNGNSTVYGSQEQTQSNAFRVTYAGKAYGLAAYSSSGADYAEYFEWKDGNPNNEDRRGRLVTLDGEKIRLATADDDYILGVVSANPCIEGDVYSDDWQGKYLTDVFGQRLTQTVHIPARYEEQEITDPETGETTTENVLVEDEHDAVQWVLNPDYDPEQEYVSREDRKEWSAIGLMGKLVVIDDGTCEVNGYCKAGVNGIATKADDGYRVMARIDDTHIRVLVR